MKLKPVNLAIIMRPPNSVTIDELSSNNESQLLKSCSKDTTKSKDNTVNHNNDHDQTLLEQKSINNPMHSFYITRLKHSLIISFLFLVPIQNFFLFFILQFSAKQPILIIIESFTHITVSLLSIVLMFYLIRNEKLLQLNPIRFSLAIYALITFNHLIPIMDNQHDIGTIENGSFVLFNIIVIYSILPLPKRTTVLLASLITLTNLAILTYFLFLSNLSYLAKLKRITCYALVYTVANLFGIYHQILTGISQEDAYKNTIKFIDGRMKLEREKQQQELLMVSVLPAHIALEMKTEMLKKTCEAQMKSINEEKFFYSEDEESNVSLKKIGV